MGRRLVYMIGMALAVGCGVRLVLAEGPARPATNGQEAGQPAELPPPADPAEPALPPPTMAEPPGRPEAYGTKAIPWPGPASAGKPGSEATPPKAAEAGPPGELPPAAIDSATALPPPPEMPPPPVTDPRVEPAQVPVRTANGKGSKAPTAPDNGPLPFAGDPPGRPATAAPAEMTRESDPFVLPAEQLPMGRQTVALSVEVIGPPTLNINQATTLKIVVKNTGSADARGVVVRDELPDGLELLSSQPAVQRSEALLFWNLTTVPAGSERVITLRIKPTKTGAFDHAATVTMRSGSKARTIVREPKLKVEQAATTGKVLKGQPVEFRITVSNPGDGPVRNVKVLAKLSPGLREGSGGPNPENLFDQSVPLINPGERIELEPLVADTILGDTQSCRVVATSPDIEPGSPDAECIKEVTVVEPKLKLTVTGPEKRYTDTIASYTISLENPGTATAKNVRVAATLPVGGQPAKLPSGAKFDSYTRRLQWTLAQIEPGEKERVVLEFQVRMGGPGLYPLAVETRADGGLADKGVVQTNVEGLADVEVDVTERRRSVDVGDETTFQIRIKNFGSKEATHLLPRAKLSTNVVPTATDNGSDDRQEAKFNQDSRELVFPQIERLGAGKELILGIKVKAEKTGLATCRVFLTHDDLGDDQLDDVAVTKVTESRR